MPTKKNIETPEKLYEYFEQYAEECKSNPKKENFWSSREGKQKSVDREIPLTWDGFEIWLRKNKIIAKLDDYISNKDNRYDEYAAIIRAIDREIRHDKMNGAYAGIYQHNIVALDLGLRQKADIDHTTKGKELPGSIDITKLDNETLQALLNASKSDTDNQE